MNIIWLPYVIFETAMTPIQSIQKFRLKITSFLAHIFCGSLFPFIHLTAMKFYGTLLALSVLHLNVWGTTAFLVQAPKPLTSKGWKATESLTTTFSYLGGLGQPPGSGDSKESGVSGKKSPSVSTADASRTVRY
jgi:hypothetical protein